MKKLFLIPLMAMLCTVMAWGADAHVSTIADLNAKLADASIETIYLDNDVTYATNETVIWVKRSVTIDGQNHTISGYGKRGARYVTISIYPDEGTYTDPLNVTLKNIKASHNAATGRSLELFHYDSNVELNIDNCEFRLTGSGNNQGVTVESTHTTVFNISNSTFNANNSGYPLITFSPLTLNLSNSEFAGYCGLYFKDGSRGAVVNANACNFDCPNVHSGASNAFSCFPLEDDGITLNLHNCGMNIEEIGDQNQAFVTIGNSSTARHENPINITLSGDNSHFNTKGGLNKCIQNLWIQNTMSNKVDLPLINVTIEGGTYSVNPIPTAEEYSAGQAGMLYYGQWKKDGDGNYTGSVTLWGPDIPDTHEVQKINQGGVTLYRVVKKAAAYVDPVTEEVTLYDLNDAVETTAEGKNPVTSFDLSVGDTMKLDENREVTTAGYVQIKDNEDTGNATVVKVGTTDNEENKVDQTLVINNGLDVQGESQVIVQAGSTIQIGEGGINTEKPENIVIEADEKGAASLIMDPTITVNQTPNLTVKMKAKQIGWMDFDGEKSYFWHRFALPIQQATTWQKSPNKSTYVYGWNYSQDQWEQYGALTQMVPFKGYTLTADYENLGDVEYTFTGQLAGNTNNNLQFERNGFNFFGNSYTGYIDILALVEQLMGDDKIDGSVWVWGSDQNYHAVPLQTLRDGGDVYATEIAPMQTFILKQNGGENATAELNYAAAVWGNPRYGNSSPAPARAIANDDTRMRIIVTADNGKSDFVMLTEADRFSDTFEKGYDGVKYMNERAINMYTTLDGEDYSNVATDNLIGKKLNIQTVNTLNYTISFAKVNGEEYALRDNVTGSIIAIREGNTYTFSAQPNATIGGRFEIVNMDMVATQIENTEVNAGVKGIYTMLGQYVGEDFNALPAGIYIVNGVKIVK